MMTRNVEWWAGITLVLALFLSAGLASASEPVVTDSRIKVFVYNENDVYNILTHYGYQSNIEFGEHEAIRTISIGDRVGWQIVPAGRRLFIRALEESAHTNMTVVTNKRAYQFDLQASAGGDLPRTHELVYVARFYYPDVDDKSPVPPIYTDDTPALPMPKPSAPAYSMSSAAPSALPRFNYQYTYSGPNGAAPVKIFDDGRYTFFKFGQGTQSLPQFYRLTAQGQEVPVSSRVTPDGFAVVEGVSDRFLLRSPQGVIQVYNEQQYRGS